MRLARYVPKLTLSELNRKHIPPAELCDLAMVGLGGERSAREARKFLSNISDRGFIPFEKSGPSKTAAKLYSLKAAIFLRCMDDLTGGENKRTYDYAAPIADAVANLADDLVQQFKSVADLDAEGFPWFVAYGSWTGNANPRLVHRNDFSPETIVQGADNGVYAASELIWIIFRRYPDYWDRERVQRGLGAPAGRYDGVDDHGLPLDPAHPTNRDLPPLDRAKRLLEIEEYIAAREATAEE